MNISINYLDFTLSSECFVGHEFLELCEVYLSVSVDICLLDHGLDLLVSERLPQVVHGELELCSCDESVTIPVKNSEGLSDVFVDVGPMVDHHVDEFVEVNSALRVLVHVTDHVNELSLARVEAMGSQNPAKFIRRNLSIPVAVKQGECFLETVNVQMSELPVKTLHPTSHPVSQYLETPLGITHLLIQ